MSLLIWRTKYQINKDGQFNWLVLSRSLIIVGWAELTKTHLECKNGVLRKRGRWCRLESMMTIWKKFKKKFLKKKKTCLIVGWITNTSIKRQDLALKQKVRMRGSETERGGGEKRKSKNMRRLKKKRFDDGNGFLFIWISFWLRNNRLEPSHSYDWCHSNH